MNLVYKVFWMVVFSTSTVLLIVRGSHREWVWVAFHAATIIISAAVLNAQRRA